MNRLREPQAARAVLIRRLMLLGLDAALVALAFWAAFALRIGEPVPILLTRNLFLLPWAIGITLAVLVASGWYRGLTRFSGSHTLYDVFPRTGLAVLLLLLVCTISGNDSPPFRTFWVLFWLLLSGGLIGSRIVLRDLLRYRLARIGAGAPGGTPAGASEAAAETEGSERAAGMSAGQRLDPRQRLATLLYGAGEAAHLLVTELRYNPRFQILAVLDDDPALWGRRMGRLPIHAPSELPKLIERHGIRQVLLAMPSAPRARRLQLVAQIRALGPAVLSMPSLASIAAGEQAVGDVRPVAIEDLLGRDPSQPDPQLLRAAVEGRSVLVTGAGGSIGSELCRQILRLGASRLVLLERNEYALYEVHRQLEALRSHGAGSAAELHPVLGDTCHQQRLEELCRRHQVQVLLHAAAYKHVPIVERNVCVGVANNLHGTRAALQAAIACGLERFLLISTDKAVRPTNAMGASKRVCELLVQDAARRLAADGRPSPRLAMVRFGNVLGSSGSVIPLFEAQIAAGGPVTVTHPSITRYFMTIPEAVQLVLQACGMAEGGEVFVLDMGEPVRILDLARQMIRLSGATVRDEENPEGEIRIDFTGLRPGEKLYEELLISSDDVATSHPLIRKAREEHLPSDRLATLIDRLLVAVQAWDEEGVRRVLAELVPEYQPRRGGSSNSTVSPGFPPASRALHPGAASGDAPRGG